VFDTNVIKKDKTRANPTQTLIDMKLMKKCFSEASLLAAK